MLLGDFPGEHVMKILALQLALVLAILSSTAHAALILGTARLSGVNAANIDETFTDTSSPVTINESSTLTGNPTGTVLGQVKVFGDDSGLFNLGIRFGQGRHDHEARFQFSDAITNETGVDQSLSLDFVIDGGLLSTLFFETPIPDMDAGYEISIDFAGIEIFSSSATVSLNGANGGSLSQSGTDLGGTFIDGFNSAQFEWAQFLGNVDLGILAAGASAELTYDVRTFVHSSFVSCDSTGCGQTNARIGDPFSVSGTPPLTSSIIPGNILFTPASAQVPEPSTLALLGAGLLGLFMRRKRFA